MDVGADAAAAVGRVVVVVGEARFGEVEFVRVGAAGRDHGARCDAADDVDLTAVGLDGVVAEMRVEAMDVWQIVLDVDLELLADRRGERGAGTVPAGDSASLYVQACQTLPPP